MAAAVANNENDLTPNGNMQEKPFLELFVKASGIDARRIGACLFCQEFWMELYALYELGLVRVEVKTVNVNSEAYKKNFSGASPPIMIEVNKGVTYSDNRELEGRIFHIAKEFMVPLFEKDIAVEKTIENLYRNFKLFLRAKVEQVRAGGAADAADSARQRMLDQLDGIDKLLCARGTRYLLGGSMTEYDCELMPRLHHMRVAGEALAQLELPHSLTHLWNYMLTAYRTAAFIESCPADQDIIHHYKEQLNLGRMPREALQAPSKTHTIPEPVLERIRRAKLDVDPSGRSAQPSP